MSMWKHHFICFQAIVEQKSTIFANFESRRVGAKVPRGELPPCPTASYGPAYEYIGGGGSRCGGCKRALWNVWTISTTEVQYKLLLGYT